MKPSWLSLSSRSLLALICSIVLLPGDTLLMAAPQTTPVAPAKAPAAAIPPEQLDSLVAPIAIYPDPLLAQVLAASTYPLEVIQLQQWLQKNKELKDKALADAASKQPWDPSVQALAGLPEVVDRLANDIKWTADLGNAFLAQQSEVMDAVQRMRQKALDKGTLKTNEQMKVETKVVETKKVIVVEQANPQVVYVPSYDPVIVYGPAYYPYPPIYYPPWGYYAAGVAISFGVGVMMGAFWSGGWGWGCGWGHNDININRNNNFNGNINRGNRPSQLPGNSNRGQNAGGKWQHNPEHRGGTPYRDKATADRFGGTTRGDSVANRQASARQQIGREGSNFGSSRPSTGLNDRAGVGNRAASGGADRIGSRDLSRSGGGDRSAFGGGNRGFSGSNARSSSSRGSSSMGSRGGGGFRGGGGGGGGRRR